MNFEESLRKTVFLSYFIVLPLFTVTTDREVRDMAPGRAILGMLMKLMFYRNTESFL